MRASQLPQTKEEIRSMAIEAESWILHRQTLPKNGILEVLDRDSPNFCWEFFQDSKQQKRVFLKIILSYCEHYKLVYITSCGDSDQQKMHSERTEKTQYHSYNESTGDMCGRLRTARLTKMFVDMFVDAENYSVVSTRFLVPIRRKGLEKWVEQDFQPRVQLKEVETRSSLQFCICWHFSGANYEDLPCWFADLTKHDGQPVSFKLPNFDMKSGILSFPIQCWLVNPACVCWWIPSGTQR